MRYTLRDQLYFLAGDLMTNIVLGTAAGLVVLHTIPAHWPMLISMPVGMLLGMFAGMILLPIFVIFFGAMEVMIPAMLTSMFAGMLVSMLAPMHSLETTDTFYISAVCTACVLSYIAGANYYLASKSK